MKIFLTLLLVLILAGCASMSTGQGALINRKSPPFSVTLLDYSEMPSSSLLGRTVVITFWDATCSHCKKSMPIVNELARSFGQSENAIFIAASVNARDQEEILRDQIAYLSLDALTHAFSGYAHQDETYRAFEGSSIPYFVIIDSSGVVRWIGDDVNDLRESFLKIRKRLHG